MKQFSHFPIIEPRFRVRLQHRIVLVLSTALARLYGAQDVSLRLIRDKRTLTDAEERALPALIRARDLWEAGEWIATGDARQKPHLVEQGIQSWIDQWSDRPMSVRLG